MTVAAVVQARMGSTRLPGKVMRALQGHTVLAQVVMRLRRSSTVDTIIVATTQHPLDDMIVDECARLNVPYYRGREHDVLDRYYEAARAHGAEVVVRVTSDCPLIDPGVLDEAVSVYLRAASSSSAPAYVSNTLERSYPRGLDVEVFGFGALEQAWRAASAPHEREHVTPYFYEHPDQFRLLQVKHSADLSALRWTLDTEEDWALLSTIYAALWSEKEPITTQAVLELLSKHPSLGELNAHVAQKPAVTPPHHG